MARILIGNIKGPKGDTGIQGPQGEIGPQGPEGPLPPLANNGLTTEPGFALDARYGKTLKDQLDTQNSNLSDKTKVIIQSFSFSIAIPGNGRTYVDVPITVPSGYSMGPFSLFGGSSRNAVTLSAVKVSSSSIAVIGSSTHSSELTISGNIDVLFYK